MIKPLGSKVLVRQDAPVAMRGLIHMPQGSEDWPPYGKVLALGPRAFEDGSVKVGDRVFFLRQPGAALNPDSREGKSEFDNLLMLKEENVVGVLES